MVANVRLFDEMIAELPTAESCPRRGVWVPASPYRVDCWKLGTMS